MKTMHIVVLLCLFIIPIYSQDHILVDGIHGTNFFSTPDGFTRMDLREVFPNDILTIVTPDSLTDITYLVDTFTTNSEVMTFIVNLPESAPAGYVQTLYVNLVDYTGHFSFVSGTITNPDGILIQNLFAGNGHADNAYGSGWTVQIQFAIETWGETKHIRIGYGNTLFSSSTHTGLYNPADYDAFLSFYDNYYFAYLEDSPDFSDTDTQALTEAFQAGLSMMLAYDYTTAIPAKPYIHIFTEVPMDASIQLTVPGKRTLAFPKPIGDTRTFGWKNIQLKPDSPNEHLWESASNQRFNFITFNFSGNSVTYFNQSDTNIYDLILLKCIDQGHFSIGVSSVLEPATEHQCKQWNIYDTKQAKDFLKQSIYSQCISVHLTKEEAYHFAYEIPWVDILILRAVKHPDQYFGFYHFDNDIYNRLVPLEIEPTPAFIERNMWVMLSNIQPREPEPSLALNPFIRDDSNEATQNYLYREYGMVDEHYSMANSFRDMAFFGFDIYENGTSISTIESYENPFALELADYASTINPLDYILQFNIADPEQYGIFHKSSDLVHPIMFAKPFMNNGRLMVLGKYTSFFYNNNYTFLNAAMHALIHSTNLGTGLLDITIPVSSLVMLQNYPNPFNPETTISFTIPKQGKVAISLYNIKGQLIKHLYTEDMEPGEHSIQWNGKNQSNSSIASQVILCKMQYDGHEYVRKIVLIK